MIQHAVFRKKDGRQFSKFFVYLLLAFLAGCVFGSILAVFGLKISWQLYERYFMALLEQDDVPFLTALSFSLKFPFVLFLCAFFSAGYLAVPLVVAARGVLFSYSVYLTCSIYGSIGLPLSIGLMLFHGVALLPLLFLLGVWSMRHALLLHTSRCQTVNDALQAAVFSLAYVFLCALLDYWITPQILRAFTTIV